MNDGGDFYLRPMSAGDRQEVSRLIYHSTNRYYVSIGRQPLFKGDDLSASDIFDVYERIDSGEGIVAVDDQSTRARVSASSASRKPASPRIARSEPSSSSAMRSASASGPKGPRSLHESAS